MALKESLISTATGDWTPPELAVAGRSVNISVRRGSSRPTEGVFRWAGVATTGKDDLTEEITEETQQQLSGRKSRGLGVIRVGVERLGYLVREVKESFNDPLDRQTLFFEFKKGTQELWETDFPNSSPFLAIVSYLEDSLHHTKSETLTPEQLDALALVVERLKNPSHLNYNDVKWCGQALRKCGFETLP